MLNGRVGTVGWRKDFMLLNMKILKLVGTDEEQQGKSGVMGRGWSS